jgi:hypothetical protein
MKKKIQLSELEIQSFVTTSLTNEQTRELNGGAGSQNACHTGLGPSGPCTIVCIPPSTSIYFTGDCSDCGW